MGLWRVMKSGLCMRTGNDQLSGWTEKKLQSTSQSQTYTKKGHGHCLVVCCRSHPVQLFESQWNHYIWEVCSANQWDASKTVMPEAAIGQQKRPHSSLRQCLTAHHTTNTSKVEGIGLQSFASSAIITDLSHQPTTTPSSITTIFCKETTITTSRRQKMISKSLLDPKA